MKTNDLDRIGLFNEMSYITVGCPYSSPNYYDFAGKNFLGSVSKVPCANKDGYFHEFERVFDGERGITSYKDIRRRWILDSNMKIIGKTWVPNSGTIKVCGSGSRVGSFQSNIPAFSPLKHSFPFVNEKKNFYTSPAQKGSGYGYNNICFNKYPEYMGNKINDFEGLYKKLNEFHEMKVAGRPIYYPPRGVGDYFTENPYIGLSTEKWPSKPKKEIDKPFVWASFPKKDGGMKAGTFHPFPTHMPCPYIDPPHNLKKEVLNDQGKRFLPNSNFPTYFPTNSVLQQNVNLRCNNLNIGNMTSVY